MRELILVGTGGFAGAILRYALSGLVNRVLPFAALPLGTVVVNLSGCLLIGFLSGLALSRGVLGSSTRLFLLVGLLGSFTTFSTFGYETLALIEGSNRTGAITNVVISVLVGLAAVWVGQAIARAM